MNFKIVKTWKESYQQWFIGIMTIFLTIIFSAMIIIPIYLLTVYKIEIESFLYKYIFPNVNI